MNWFQDGASMISIEAFRILNFGMDLENEKNRVGIWDYQLIASGMAV